MPKEMLEEKINGRAPTAIDYALANHKAETGDAQLEFESDADVLHRLNRQILRLFQRLRWHSYDVKSDILKVLPFFYKK